MKEFDYYIFIDYSENFIGYSIIERDKIKELIPKISRLRHYRDLRNKKIYLKNIKKTIKRENIKSYFLKLGIKEMYKNTDIYAVVLEFIKGHANCVIFISVDNRQFKAFKKLVSFVNGKKVFIKKESELVRGTPEYQVSLVLDNLLNIERLKKMTNLEKQKIRVMASVYPTPHTNAKRIWISSGRVPLDNICNRGDYLNFLEVQNE